MISHGVIFNLGSAEVCSPAIMEISFSYIKDKWIAVTDYYTVEPLLSDHLLSKFSIIPPPIHSPNSI